MLQWFNLGFFPTIKSCITNMSWKQTCRVEEVDVSQHSSCKVLTRYPVTYSSSILRAFIPNKMSLSKDFMSYHLVTSAPSLLTFNFARVHLQTWVLSLHHLFSLTFLTLSHNNAKRVSIILSYDAIKYLLDIHECKIISRQLYLFKTKRTDW